MFCYYSRYKSGSENHLNLDMKQKELIYHYVAEDSSTHPRRSQVKSKSLSKQFQQPNSSNSTPTRLIPTWTPTSGLRTADASIKQSLDATWNLRDNETEQSVMEFFDKVIEEVGGNEKEHVIATTKPRSSRASRKGLFKKPTKVETVQAPTVATPQKFPQFQPLSAVASKPHGMQASWPLEQAKKSSYTVEVFKSNDTTIRNANDIARGKNNLDSQAQPHPRLQSVKLVECFILKRYKFSVETTLFFIEIYSAEFYL